MIRSKSLKELMTMPINYINHASIMLILILMSLISFFFFDVGDDSRSSSFEKRGDDAIQTTLNDLLEVLDGLITKSRTKKLKYTFNELI
jgi:ATP/ADP translocase